MLMLFVIIILIVFLFDLSKIRNQNDRLIEQNEKIISLLDDIKNSSSTDKLK
ncbi:hypothetical protein [Piscibacillus halophilus]|uniref:Uncharacterized protein n=1 Tax=Piscibacillus halophilus TaxID=571933 RepID=A0A1H9AQS8_9BACI|nr:hypothetical protein [Piscibacillus halophilus]SEP79136.1 hypothetical protein SAMN05216362_10324 [Piscibacillus halophilus]